MTAEELLIEAKQLLINKGWTQKAYARRNGEPVLADDPSADCYCAMGALRVTAGREDSDELEGAIEAIGEALGKLSAGIVAFNDSPETTVEHVLQVFGRAIDISRLSARDS